MSKLRVAISIILIFLAIMAYDVYLYTDNIEGNSITQVIIWLTDLSPLMPFAGGYLMGFLTCHFWESYFLRDKDK